MLSPPRYDEVIQNAKSLNGKLQGEYAIVVVGGKSIALVEVKYAVNPSDIEKSLPGFKAVPEVAEDRVAEPVALKRLVGSVLPADAGHIRRLLAAKVISARSPFKVAPEMARPSRSRLLSAR